MCFPAHKPLRCPRVGVCRRATPSGTKWPGMREMDFDRLLEVVTDERSVLDLREYFDQGDADRPPAYTGSRFEGLGGGGDGPDVRDRITPWDLVAVECLSVRVPTSVGLDLLEGGLGDQLGGYLSELPTDVDLGSGEAGQHLVDGSPADIAWKTLRDQTDVGWVTAGKLLARKRPRLIPVWDRVVKCEIPHSEWTRWLCGDGRLVQR
jgi:hypothetical protein